MTRFTPAPLLFHLPGTHIAGPESVKDLCRKSQDYAVSCPRVDGIWMWSRWRPPARQTVEAMRAPVRDPVSGRAAPTASAPSRCSMPSATGKKIPEVDYPKLTSLAACVDYIAERV